MSTKTDELMRLHDEAARAMADCYMEGTEDPEEVAAEARGALRTAIQEALSHWRSIETAPKDGTHILLANKAGASEGGWLTDVDHGADWEGQLGMAGWWRTDGTDWPNTHWQPLPEPPEAS